MPPGGFWFPEAKCRACSTLAHDQGVFVCEIDWLWRPSDRIRLGQSKVAQLEGNAEFSGSRPTHQEVVDLQQQIGLLESTPTVRRTRIRGRWPICNLQSSFRLTAVPVPHRQSPPVVHRAPATDRRLVPGRRLTRTQIRKTPLAKAHHRSLSHPWVLEASCPARR